MFNCSFFLIVVINIMSEMQKIVTLLKLKCELVKLKETETANQNLKIWRHLGRIFLVRLEHITNMKTRGAELGVCAGGDGGVQYCNGF